MVRKLLFALTSPDGRPIGSERGRESAEEDELEVPVRVQPLLRFVGAEPGEERGDLRVIPADEIRLHLALPQFHGQVHATRVLGA